MRFYLARLSRKDHLLHYQRPRTNKSWCNTTIDISATVGPATDHTRCEPCAATLRVIGAIQSALTSTSDEDEAELAFDVLMTERKADLRRLTRV